MTCAASANDVATSPPPSSGHGPQGRRDVRRAWTSWPRSAPRGRGREHHGVVGLGGIAEVGQGGVHLEQPVGEVLELGDVDPGHGGDRSDDAPRGEIGAVIGEAETHEAELVAGVSRRDELAVTARPAFEGVSTATASGFSAVIAAISVVSEPAATSNGWLATTSPPAASKATCTAVNRAPSQKSRW